MHPMMRVRGLLASENHMGWTCRGRRDERLRCSAVRPPQQRPQPASGLPGSQGPIGLPEQRRAKRQFALVAGNVWGSSPSSDGTTNLKVAMTASPNTTYHFFLKCVRLLGDIPTDGEEVANVSFSFPTNSVGNVYAFDMYPQGAPPGNKFQSAQVKFQLVTAAPTHVLCRRAGRTSHRRSARSLRRAP